MLSSPFACALRFLLQLESLERNKLTGAELLSRIQLLENRVDAATAVAGLPGSMNGRTDGTSSSSGGGASFGRGGTSQSSAAAAVAAAAAATAGAASGGDTAAAAAAAAAGAAGAVGFLPFAQAKLVKQVAALEQQTVALQASSAQLVFRTEQVGHQ
jgi:hypothetical protein